VHLTCDEALVDRRHPRLSDVRRAHDGCPLERPLRPRRLAAASEVEELASVVEALQRVEGVAIDR
jgi:hypothetical protein